MNQPEQGSMTIGEMAKALGVPRYRVQYAIDAGIIPDAAQRIGGRRVFSQAEAERAIEILRQRRQAHEKQ